LTLELIRRWLALQLYAVPLALLQGAWFSTPQHY